MSARSFRVICVPEELLQEMLVQFIANLCHAQNAWLGTWSPNDVIRNLEDIIASNESMKDHLLLFFPKESDRNLLIRTVEERTGFVISHDFLVGREEESPTDPVQGTHLDS